MRNVNRFALAALVTAPFITFGTLGDARADSIEVTEAFVFMRADSVVSTGTADQGDWDNDSGGPSYHTNFSSYSFSDSVAVASSYDSGTASASVNLLHSMNVATTGTTFLWEGNVSSAFNAGGAALQSSGEFNGYERNTFGMVSTAYMIELDTPTFFERSSAGVDSRIYSGPDYHNDQIFGSSGTLSAGRYRIAFDQKLSARTESSNDSYFRAMLTLTPTAAPVPLPAAAWGGMALFGGLGINRLRRRR